LNEVPAGGWTDEHKTTKLVMRRIEPGTFVMNDKYNVTLTKPFYMGVYEVTQKQYELVTGNNPSQLKGDARPVEYVSWNMIRGSSDVYNWPSNRTVDAASFMGIIQQKTGLGLDLPTEAQWEYACRAGTTSKYNNGGSTTNDLNVLGRYLDNRNDGKGGYSEHTTVGSYLPNAWGLYDMHGNVFEWCLDWRGSLSNGTDPEGPVSGSYRVVRGGRWNYDGYDCPSSYRFNNYPSNGSNGGGFRVACSAGL
jgi:formylglycine-generating enzyme required for sulfatase activity